jgi:soluble lytic murein transglycosylase
LISKLFITKVYYVVFLFGLISCPSPGSREFQIERIPAREILIEAEQNAEKKPLYSFNLLKKITDSRYEIDKAKILLKIYVNQREYSRASSLLDSLNTINLKDDTTLKRLCLSIYLNQKRWDKILDLTDDPLLKGIALYNLQRYQEAIEYLTQESEIKDYQAIKLSRCYYKLNDLQKALEALSGIDSLSPFLSSEFQNLLFDILLNLANIALVRKELPKIKDPAIKKFLQLKVCEWQNDKKNIRQIGIDLIRNYPASSGAKYCISVLKPANGYEYKSFGKVAFIHNDYSTALKFFKKAIKDDDVYYYIGKIYYDQQQYDIAMNYLRKSNRAEAYFYRALIYENRQNYYFAISLYDSIINHHKGSKYAVRALKRKAFILEDIGDTLGAIEAFVRVKERTTSFRAGFQLYRTGNLNKALDIFSNYKEPDFLYWQMKIMERLGESTDSLKNLLLNNYPLSYYTLIKCGAEFSIDTNSLENWLKKFGDSTTTFDHTDSIHLERALKFFKIGESGYAFAELESIEDKSFFDLIYLSRLCAENGYDYGAIKFCLQIKKRLENDSDTKNYPVDFLKLLYPVRYIFTIIENTGDPWLTLAIIWQESNFNPDAQSRADARGLMQIIPNTGKLIARKFGIDSFSLYDPQISIKFGTYYFKEMLDEYNSLPLALAAYNAGPINLNKWLKKNSNAETDEFIELIPFSETRDYVRLTMARHLVYKKIWHEL